MPSIPLSIATEMMMLGTVFHFLFFINNFSQIFADICMKSVFLHSIKPLEPSNKLFCIINQNENVKPIKATSFRTVDQFRKYLPTNHAVLSSQTDGIIEVWEDEKAIPFEHPAAVFSDHCTGTVPLSLLANISLTCLPRWNIFDEKHCIDLKYLNVSYYLRKYSTKKNGNRTIVSMESILPEKNQLIRWLYWNGTACINAVSRVLIKFITNDGMLEDISANVRYVNITEQSYPQQFYQFEAHFIEISSPLNAMEETKPLGYDWGEVIQIESITNETFGFPSGMECKNLKKHINVRFGIQIHAACRLRKSSCTEMLAEIQHLLDKWNDISVYSLPYTPNETITAQYDRLLFLKEKNDKSCKLITAASIQFSYERVGNIQFYSHRLVSYQIELNNPVVIDLTIYPYQYIYFNLMIYFIDRTAPPVQLFAKIPTINIALPPDFFYPLFTKSLL